MKLINFTYSIVPLLLLMTACSSNKLITKQSTDDDISKDHQIKEASETELCIYKKEKGIAEVTAINLNSYQFKFYLGDDVFEISKTEIKGSTDLKIGDEFKAVKEVMVNNVNRQDCPPVEYHLIH